MKTYSQKPTEVSRKWYVLDASSAPLGRLSTEIAKLLTGKHKPTFTPHTDGGDYVIVINTDKCVLTGNKEHSKKYYRHSGYPGGIKERTVAEQRQKDSRKIIEASVFGMLPKNKLRDGRMLRLKLYTEDKHQHEAQKPVMHKVGK